MNDSIIYRIDHGVLMFSKNSSIYFFLAFTLALANVSLSYAACGDGTVDAGELCDDGNDLDFDSCRSDCTLGPNIQMVTITKGSFSLGSGSGDEQPLHAVTLPSFRLSQGEITKGLYRLCVDTGVCMEPNPSFLCGWKSTPKT